jgi:hypothetical protein
MTPIVGALSVSIPHAACMIGIGETTLRALIADKVIPVCGVRGRRVIRVADLETYLASTVQP